MVTSSRDAADRPGHLAVVTAQVISAAVGRMHREAAKDQLSVSGACRHRNPAPVGTNQKGDAMAPEANRRPRPAPLVTMELLGAAAMRALLDGDLAEASWISRRQLPPFFLEEKWLWKIRVDQVRTTPEDAPWLVRVVALEPSGVVIGHAGFHGRPDAAGAVEIAYTVAPEHRGNGYAHAVLAALVEEARTHPEVNLVRATISPDNHPSIAVIRRGRFVQVGEQWDDVDGLELVFERHLDAATAEVSGPDRG